MNLALNDPLSTVQSLGRVPRFPFGRGRRDLAAARRAPFDSESFTYNSLTSVNIITADVETAPTSWPRPSARTRSTSRTSSRSIKRPKDERLQGVGYCFTSLA